MVQMGEIGTTGLDHAGGMINEEWNQDLQGSAAMRKFREMVDNSAVLGGWFALTELLIRQVDLRVDAGRDADSARAERDRIRESFDDMENPVDVIISEISSSLPFGFDVHEKLFKLRRGPEESDPTLRSDYTDGRIGWRDWAFRSQDTVQEWEFDGNGRWTAFVQSAPPDYRPRVIPREKLIHFTPRAWRRSPEGRSMLRSAVRAYNLAFGHETQEGIAGEKNASGQLWATTPLEGWGNNADANAVAIRREIEKGIAKFRRGEYTALTFPPEKTRNGEETGFKLAQLDGARAMFPYGETIRRLEGRQLIAVLSEFILSGIEQHGSFSLHDSKTNLLALALGAILKGLCAVLTIAAAELSTLNGVPVEDHTVVCHDDIETPELTHMANFVAQILGIDPSRLNDELRRHLELYARLPAGALASPPAAPQQSVPEEARGEAIEEAEG